MKETEDSRIQEARPDICKKAAQERTRRQKIAIIIQYFEGLTDEELENIIETVNRLF